MIQSGRFQFGGGHGEATRIFDVEERLQRLSNIGDQLEAYAAVVDFGLFRPDLETALGYSDGSKGGRPAYDPVLMFKILVIQAQNGLSDDKAEFLINDRLSFMRFLGLDLSDRVPDAKTIWMFRARLTRAGAIDGLSRRFDAAIREAGYIAMSGQIVDSSLVAAPKQRNTRDKKQAVKAGKSAHEIWPDITLRRRARKTWTPVGRSKPARPGVTGIVRCWTLRSRASATRPTRASTDGID